MLNAAAGRHRINTGLQFYSELEVEYCGVEAADHPDFNLQPLFIPAAQFIDEALSHNGQWRNVTPECYTSKTSLSRWNQTQTI